MHCLPRRSSVVLVLLAWLTLVLMAVSLLVVAEVRRLEQSFNLGVKAVSAEMASRLLSYEALLSGFAAFLQAVDADDLDATMRYAATVVSAYPDIYMVEVARRVPAMETESFVDTMRTVWRPDFAMRSFADLNGREPQGVVPGNDGWPILFAYPPPGHELDALYGLRLETVDHLAATLARAHGYPFPVASPAFELLEGGTGYILLKTVERAAPRNRGTERNFFGEDLAALLVIRSGSLVPTTGLASARIPMGIAATLVPYHDGPRQLFELQPPARNALEQWLLPVFRKTVGVGSATQHVELAFEQQHGFEHVLDPARGAIIAVLLAGILIGPWVLLRHFKALRTASVEHERAAYLATHDVLTGLPNRYLLADRFDQALHGWERNGTSFALLLVDLDRFKEINDQHGHDAGDQMLRVVAERMTGQLRSFDTVARYGGDEFVVLLLDVIDATDAVRVGHKLLAAVSRPVDTSAGSLVLSCSVGVAVCPDHGKDFDALRRQADLSMYEAKQAGRNTVVLARPGLAQGSRPADNPVSVLPGSPPLF